MKLRPYQTKIIDQARAVLAGAWIINHELP